MSFRISLLSTIALNNENRCKILKQSQKPGKKSLTVLTLPQVFSHKVHLQVLINFSSGLVVKAMTLNPNVPCSCPFGSRHSKSLSPLHLSTVDSLMRHRHCLKKKIYSPKKKIYHGKVLRLSLSLSLSCFAHPQSLQPCRGSQLTTSTDKHTKHRG